MGNKDFLEYVIKDCENFNKDSIRIDIETLKELVKELEILEILIKCEDEKHSLYCVNVLNALSSGKITQDDVIKVKEWLDENNTK